MHHRPIQFIVGLGNPGREHQGDRHNVGFWFLDLLAREYGARFREERKFGGEMAKADIQGVEVRLLKPMTYMNRSGSAVQSACAYFRIPPEQVLVVHDDLDLPPGKARLKKGGGHGGHNGLRNVISHLGRDFFRMRFGIGHPGVRVDVIEYVLAKPSRDDEELILEGLREALQVMPILLGHGEEKAMTRLHTGAPQARSDTADSGSTEGERD